jgi:inositol-1,4,5-trisphosphate 5-phosphatase
MRELLLITANVGSLFDKKVDIRRAWIVNILKTIQENEAKLICIHMQETGGKDYKVYSKDVPGLVEELYRHLSTTYTHCCAFLDLDFDCIEEYTALGSIVFVHRSVAKSVRQYSFTQDVFAELGEVGITLRDTLANCQFVRKEKFPRQFWPTMRWGRKGYLHTRWLLNDRPIDFINIHLFHDESNLAIQENPNVYSENRKQALNFVLERYDEFRKNNGDSWMFAFGDFNFRLNPDSFLKKITNKTKRKEYECENGHYNAHKCSSDDSEPSLSSPGSLAHLHEPLRKNLSAIEFHTTADDTAAKHCKNGCLLRIEKKRFDYANQSRLIEEWKEYREDDCESRAFPPLKELDVCFPPTYPWSEDPHTYLQLMNTRAPAWCDRVLMNEEAWKVVSKDPNHLYTCLGVNVLMGDHKPVVLSFSTE